MALSAGRVGVAQVGELARVRANPRVGDDIVEDIDQLLGWAGELGFEGFRTVLRRWEQLADVDGTHQAATRAHDGRRAWLHRVDDTFHLRAQFGVVQGTAMMAILDAFADAEYQADRDDLAERSGHDADASMLKRSEAQRRADAVHAIFLAAVTGGGRRLTTPLVNMVVDQRCETVAGDPVEPSDMIAAVLIGHVRRVVVDRAGVVIDAGRARRLFTGPARILVGLLDRTCCWPGCGHRVDLQADHLREYSRDGPTDQYNAAPLHGRHNRFKTTHRYRITRDPHGHLHTWRPDSTELKPR